MIELIIAISGKRKSGKDYCANVLKKFVEENRIAVEISGISHSLKKEFAKIHNIDFNELLTDGPYKEKYRKEMIEWGEEKRKIDPGVFCRCSVDQLSTIPRILIISDCRRISDMDYFKNAHRTITVRIETSDLDRESRGFRFVKGIDDAESECGLDNYNFDFRISNSNSNSSNLEKQLREILKQVL